MSSDESPTFCVDYKFGGKTWAITIEAKDEAEAGRRLRAIGMTGVVLGELVGTVEMHRPKPASVGRVRWHLLRALLSPLKAA